MSNLKDGRLAFLVFSALQKAREDRPDGSFSIEDLCLLVDDEPHRITSCLEWLKGSGMVDSFTALGAYGVREEHYRFSEGWKVAEEFHLAQQAEAKLERRRKETRALRDGGWI